MKNLNIGIVKTDTVRESLSPEFGEYPDMFTKLLSETDDNLNLITYDVEHQEYPRDINDVDAYLITGSKYSVYDNEPWIIALTEFVRELHRAHKKLIGICFGHQMVAHALGGRVEKAGKGWGLGVSESTLTSSDSWHTSDNRFNLLMSHQDQVMEPPGNALVIATTKFCPILACQLENHILTFQGHPEFSKSYYHALMEVRREILGEELYSKALEGAKKSIDNDKVARWIVNFLRKE